ncbi:MAG TPA: twin-arginine translocase subunit TatC [Chloroflexota bacterium]|nr:twin-arginine translocase subunit TatC [Chloroflexota bacterium]
METTQQLNERPVMAGDEEFEGSKVTLIEHLEELRTRLIIATLALLVATFASFIFTEWLLKLLLVPAGDIKPVFLKPTEMFVTYFKVALIGGVAIATPVILYQLIRFVVPGLKPGEKKYLLLVLPGATLLFLLGVSFGYRVLLPFALGYLLNFGGGIALPTISIGEYVTFVVTLLLWMGVSFETPMVIVFLAKLGVVNHRQLRSYWKYALVGAFLAAAIITPTPDPVNQAMVAVPLYLLYEIGVLFARLV